MVYTKRKVETENDRFGGYAAPFSAWTRTEEESDNNYSQNDYSSNNVNNFSSNTSASQTTFSPYSYGTTTEVDEPHTDYQTPSYEYEREYSPVRETETLPNENLNPFKVKPFEMQTIKTNKIASGKLKINVHGKILLSVYSAICLILVAFAIYNTVMISGIASANATQADVLSAKQQVINVLEDEYNFLGSDEGVSSRLATDNYFDEFVVADNSNTVTIYLGEIGEVPNYTAPSNWFDKVCEFFSELLN